MVLPLGRRSGMLGLASAAAAGLATTSTRGQTSARRSRRKLRLAHTAPTTHGWHLWGEQFKRALEADSGGALQVELLPNAQMGTERDIAQAVRIGALEMGAVGVALMNWVPELSLTDAPFLFASREHAYHALDGMLGEELKKLAARQAFHLLAWTDLGFRSMTNSRRAIASAGDLKTIRMRVPETRSYISMMEALGASVVTVDLSELYFALAQGVADGQETPTVVVQSNRYFEVQRFISKTDHILTNAYVVMNPELHQNLSLSEKEMIAGSATMASQWLRSNVQGMEEKAYAFLESKGMQVNLNPDRGSFQKACSGLLERLPDLFRPELVRLAG